MPECNARILIFKETKVVALNCIDTGGMFKRGMHLLDGNILAFEKW